MESDIDWSDEGADSAKSTENESQFKDSSSEAAKENVNSLGEEGKTEIDSDFDQDNNTSLQYGAEMADPVCIKLNDLTHRGKIESWVPNPLQIFKRRIRNLLQSFARI